MGRCPHCTDGHRLDNSSADVSPGGRNRALPQRPGGAEQRAQARWRHPDEAWSPSAAAASSPSPYQAEEVLAGAWLRSSAVRLSMVTALMSCAAGIAMNTTGTALRSRLVLA